MRVISHGFLHELGIASMFKGGVIIHLITFMVLLEVEVFVFNCIYNTWPKKKLYIQHSQRDNGQPGRGSKYLALPQLFSI